MQKDILTKEIIIKELCTEKYITSNLVGLLLSILACSFFIWLSTFSDGFKDAMYPIYAACIMAVTCCGYISNIYIKLKEIRFVKSEKFYITEDVLIEAKEMGRYIDSALKIPYQLIFKTYGEYDIPIQNYGWSQYKMDDKGVYIHAVPGNGYYLVIGRKNRILRAYNKKHFDFKES